MYDRLRRDAEPIDLAGKRIHIASIAQLIDMKEAVKPPRDKDRLDVSALKALKRKHSGD